MPTSTSRPPIPKPSPASLLNSVLPAPASADSPGVPISPGYLIAPFSVVDAVEFACCFDEVDSRIEGCSGLFVVD